MKIYNSEEISKATELECHNCGITEKTNPKSLKLPIGWVKVNVCDTKDGKLLDRNKFFLCPDCVDKARLDAEIEKERQAIRELER